MEKELAMLPYWEHLTETERERIQSYAKKRTYEAGEIIRGHADQCLGMVMVLSGSVRVSMVSQEGREITLFHIAAGDSCIMSASCVVPSIGISPEMCAEGETCLLAVPAGVFSGLMAENVHVRCFAYELSTKRLSSVAWVMQQIIFMRFDARLAGFLLEECDLNGSDTVHMTQEAVAREVNTAREVVSRMLYRFADEGYIALSRGTIRVIDRQALQNIL